MQTAHAPSSIVLGYLQVRVGVVKRSKASKTHTPNEIASQRPALASKLPEPATWSEKRTTSTNYCRASLAHDPNITLSGRCVDSAAGQLASDVCHFVSFDVSTSHFIGCSRRTNIVRIFVQNQAFEDPGNDFT